MMQQKPCRRNAYQETLVKQALEYLYASIAGWLGSQTLSNMGPRTLEHDYDGQVDFLTVIGMPSRGLASKTNSWNALSPKVKSRSNHSTLGVLFGFRSAQVKSKSLVINRNVIRTSSMAKG